MEFYKTAEGSFISFEYKTAKNNFLSDKEQRPVFDKVLIGTIKSPGQQKSELDMEFIREDINGNERKNENAWKLYGEQAKAFINKTTSPEMQGTPIEKMPGIDMKVAASLKALNVFTVEALAVVNDTGLAAIGMGGRKLKAEAEAYVASCKNKEQAQELLSKYAAENAEMKEQIASLTSIVNELKRDKETAPKKRASNK
jgi:hypothetical protein